jgi:hypothetical protein
MDGDPEATTRATRELLEAGHTVERCCEPGAVPCHLFLNHPECPLNRGRLDVALIARDHVWPGPPLERGTTCMLRAGVPMASVDSPSDDAAAVCLRAVRR